MFINEAFETNDHMQGPCSARSQGLFDTPDTPKQAVRSSAYLKSARHAVARNQEQLTSALQDHKSYYLCSILVGFLLVELLAFGVWDRFAKPFMVQALHSRGKVWWFYNFNRVIKDTFPTLFEMPRFFLRISPIGLKCKFHLI